MRLLTFTNLYPSDDLPRHGIFVEERLRQLVASGDVSADVVALRPCSSSFLGERYAGASGRAAQSVRHGIRVTYTPVPSLPGATNWVDPWLWANAAEATVRRLLGGSRTDVIIDAHFLYPDAVAAALLAKRLGLPIVMTARGSDVNVKCGNPIVRAWVRWAAANCAALLTVSRALAEVLSRRGIGAEIVEVVRNGVDLEKFRRYDQPACRKGSTDRVLVSVGHLIPAKGHDIAIKALPSLPEARLLIAGEGPERRSLEKLAAHMNVSSRVRFLGFVPHDRMPEVYSLGDALLLPSLREGMPNVVLESLACGTPVIATDVGGVREILTSPDAGELMRERSPSALRDAYARLFSRTANAADTRRFAEQFEWKSVVEKQLLLYQRVLARSRDRRMSAAT